MTARGVFIAGTDTGIGKTYASCALLHALRGAGVDAVGMKPVASGCEATPQGLRNADALALQAASAPPMPSYALVNPVALAEAVSPHLAARAAGVEVTLPPLRAAYAALAAGRERVVVEGVGGWLAPLSDTLPASALASGLGLPVILVVGLRLGCLNHAQLSARAIAADGCRLLGWIGNVVDPTMARLDDNLDTLRRLLPAPCLGVLDYAPDREPAAQASALARAVAALRAAAA